MQMKTMVRWAGWNGEGLDHCLLLRDGDGLCLEGLVIGTGDTGTGAARYKLRTDAALRTREVVVSCLGGPELWLVADGTGTWTDGRTGAAIRALAGCLDVDIAATPATNSLPILRLGLAVGEGAEIRAAYLPVPGGPDTGPEARIDPMAACQRYTRLGDGRYRYESLSSGFTCEIGVDRDGVVTDYPGIFRRLDGPSAAGDFRPPP